MQRVEGASTSVAGFRGLTDISPLLSGCRVSDAAGSRRVESACLL